MGLFGRFYQEESIAFNIFPNRFLSLSFFLSFLIFLLLSVGTTDRFLPTSTDRGTFGQENKKNQRENQKVEKTTNSVERRTMF